MEKQCLICGGIPHKLNIVFPSKIFIFQKRKSFSFEIHTKKFRKKFHVYGPLKRNTYLPRNGYPVNMPLVASITLLVQCWQHLASTGPVLANNGMFMRYSLKCCQYRACTRPILPASDQYRPIA